MVLDVARLTELSNNYANAKAQVQTAQAKLAASKPAFDRAQKLYNANQAVSLAAQLQSAEAAFLADQAALAAAEAQVRTLIATAYQEWGSVLGKSLVEESPMIARLIERQDFLLQITLPPGVTVAAPPATAAIETRQGARAAITFVSPATRIDPKIQGVSFFYTAPAASGVLPGMNVLAFLPSGRSSTASPCRRPRSFGGRIAPGFIGAPVRDTSPAPRSRPTCQPKAAAISSRTCRRTREIVTGGAQLLLSEEFRAQIQVDEDN